MAQRRNMVNREYVSGRYLPEQVKQHPYPLASPCALTFVMKQK
ncbi:hypothetical protein SpAn4DRAFT_2035 [Sporomusa ovata]|uniref:Uncharacterized protein n=1 Tax=Sporomusa ovata TaxID=2378 RepID=A0A0U1KUG8_9FIRM|nr:hypothetical protein SpAn4DRAFT_2035 [Sporomusa ovata]